MGSEERKPCCRCFCWRPKKSVCGIRRNTLIVNLPGSTKAAQECFESVAMSIPHAVALMRNRTSSVEAVHNEVQSQVQSPQQHQQQHHHHHNNHQHHHHHHHHNEHGHKDAHSMVDASRVARRHRESPYPVIEVSAAQKIILQHASAMKAENVGFADALGRILVADVHAKDPLPPFPASIKDGYAAVSSDGTGVRVVVGDSVAGHEPNKIRRVCRGEVMRINTGAPVPDGADCVVQVEDTRLLKEGDDGRTELEIEILKPPFIGQDIRPTGSDIAAGQLVLTHGSYLGPCELGLLATVGVTSVSVHRLPMVAVLSTGNELQDPCQPLIPGHIRDSNKTMLLGIFADHNFPAVDLGIARDDPQSLLVKLKEALSAADVVVTTGSLSMGERDFIKDILTTDLGATIHFGRVWMKPGKPMTFATLQYEGKKKLVLALPGNPVSAAVTCHLFVLPALRKMAGYHSPLGTTVTALTAEDIILDARPEYHRVTLTWEPSSSLPVAKSTGNQISSRLLSLSAANGLLVLPPRSDSQKTLSAGSKVPAIIIARL
ncbi:gephyrin isoform X2 [Anabrus simplex]|uniref:gephyrin isoform X2 n=1 Tax=Anabrus simplex TaxID=316456 RepID=UPI0035A396F9